MSLPSRSRLAILGFSLLAPILGLAALDLAIERATPFWEWVAHDYPRRLDDSFLNEALLRATPPGRENVLLVGNSRADDGVDLGALETRFSDRSLHFRNLTVVGSGVVDEAMRARELTRVEPGAVIAVLGPSELRNGGWDGETFAYDAAAAAHVFELRDLAADPEFHVSGLAGELHILARHRRAFQDAALVGLGRKSFMRVRLDAVRDAGHDPVEKGAVHPISAWITSDERDTYPNTNTRALEFMAETLHAAGTRLIVVEGPLHPWVGFSNQSRPKVEQFRSFVAEQAERHGFVFIPATRLPTLEMEQFKDLIHLNDSGRATFTAGLANELDSLL